MFIIIVLAILSQWFYSSLSALQARFLELIDLGVDKVRLAIHKKAHLRKFTYKIPRLSFLILFWLVLLICYTLIHHYAVWLSYAVFYILALICINMPIQNPWQTEFKSKGIYKKWLELFAVNGNDMANQQANKDNISNFEACGKAMLSMWCYSFILPLLFFSLPYGDIICLSWIMLRYVCLQLNNTYLICIIEWIPRHIILILSAIIGNFESCISSAKQEKNSQRNIQITADKDIEGWLWSGVKGAINIDIINSNYHYQQFLVFLSKLVLAVIILYILTSFL